MLRHAEAADGHPDETRRLTDRGRADARTAGVALARLGIKLDACLTSPKLRAAETAELACEVLGLEVESVAALAGGGYDPGDLAAGRGEVLIVGHDPTLSQLVGDLTGARVHLKKGAIASIDGAELRMLLPPRVLRAIAAGESR